jgi:trans-aconitate 2-methyltransferase
MADWDAARYHRISSPQFDWGQRVIERLKPASGERILDLGCGTGRLTREIAAATNGARVVGLDRSGAMIAVARASLEMDRDPRVMYVQASGVALPFGGVFDAVFSAATLHWIHDHAAVFASVFDALARGGRFVAQCGGTGNLDRLLEHAARLMVSPAYEVYFRDWAEPWHFADPRTSAERLRKAGFVDVETWLEEAPVDLGTPAAFGEFVSCVCVRNHLDRLPLSLRGPFVDELTQAAARDSPPLTLDYWRLNMDARKSAA